MAPLAYTTEGLNFNGRGTIFVPMFPNLNVLEFTIRTMQRQACKYKSRVVRTSSRKFSKNRVFLFSAE